MKQILVVGSDPRISQDLDRFLDPKEYKLLVSPYGKSVITSLTNVKPDLVILDLDSVDQKGTETMRKIRELNSELPLIVLSKNSAYQEREKKEKNFILVSPPFKIEKIASMAKETLSSKAAKQRGKVFLGSMRFSSHKAGQLEVEKKSEKSSENPHLTKQDYHHLFEQSLAPIFERIIRDCRGRIYDCLLCELERTMISEVLKYANHNQVKASQLLGISRNTLRERMKRFDIF